MSGCEMKEYLLAIAQDLGEVAIDDFIEDGIWKDIPVLSTAVNLAKISTALRERAFLRKLRKFLYEYEKLVINEKEKIKKKILSYYDQELLGEEITKTIDDSENSKKASLLGKGLTILLEDSVDTDFYLSLANKISKCYYADILHLKDFETENSEYFACNDKIPGISLDQLYFCGFLIETGYNAGNLSGTEPCGRRYQLNEYGVTVRSLLLNI